jgi:hypothetical protein
MTSYGSVSVANGVATDCASNTNGVVDNITTTSETTSLLVVSNNSTININNIKFVKVQDASLWSKLTFGWMEPMMRFGNAKKRLDHEDITHIPLPINCQSGYVSDAFEESWKKEMERAKTRKKQTGSKQEGGGSINTNNHNNDNNDNNDKNNNNSNRDHHPSLIRALFRAFGADFLIGGFILKFVHDSCIFVGPQVLNRMILYLGSTDAPLSRGLGLTLAVTISQLCMSFCLRHYFFKCYKFGLMIRTAVVVAVYKKALLLSAGERQGRSLGEITNLMSIDAQRLQELTTYLHAIWYSFWQIGLALFFLWQQLYVELE